MGGGPYHLWYSRAFITIWQEAGQVLDMLSVLLNIEVDTSHVGSIVEVTGGTGGGGVVAGLSHGVRHGEGVAESGEGNYQEEVG